MKKLLSVLLCMLMLTAVLAPAGVQAADYQPKYPIVRVMGANHNVYDGNGKMVFPASTKSILDAFDDGEYAKSLLKEAGKGYLTGDYSTYAEMVYDLITEYYGDDTIDEHTGSYVDGYKPYNYNAQLTYDSYVTSSDYAFNYDWRLDPMDAADKLHDYIDRVLATTGAEKVCLITRCEGCAVMLCYLNKYASEQKVYRNFFNASSTYGSELCSAMFSGTARPDAQALEDFIEAYKNGGKFHGVVQLLEDRELTDTIQTAFYGLNFTYTLGLPLDQLKVIYDALGREGYIQRILLDTFAQYPSYWTMVDDEHYEAAKKYIFGSKIDEYSEIIKKLDNYHYNIFLNQDKILKDAEALGIKTGGIAKYGYAMIPIYIDSRVQCDDTFSTRNSSFGASSLRIDKSFSKEYIQAAEAKGTAKYISPDNIIDASTCLFPDTTWILKYVEHSMFGNPSSTQAKIARAFFSTDDFTVFSDPELPQFMEYTGDEDALVPVEAVEPEGEFEQNVNGVTSAFKKLFNFFKLILDLIKKLFTGQLSFGK